MSKKVTIYDVAERLGISTATINRALNGKAKVSDSTRRLVMKTAEEMGYRANRAARSLSRKSIRIGLIIDEITHDFNIKVVNGAKKACADLSDFNVSGDFQVVDRPNSRTKMIAKMREMGQAGLDGILIAQTDDHPEYGEVIDELLAKGIPVVLMISDLPNSRRLFCVKTNGFVSGRMAEQLLSILVPDKPVAIFTGFKERGIHRENVAGFLEQRKTASVNLATVYENYDDANLAYHMVDKLIADYPDIGGLYVGTSNSISVCRRIIELGMDRKIRIIASDVFPQLNEYIKAGVVSATIFQEPFNIGRLAFKYLYESIAEGRTIESSVLLNPQIVMSSNLDLFSRET